MNHPRNSLFLFAALSLALPCSANGPSTFDERPIPQRAPSPEYPEDLKEEKIEGTVILKISIDETGNVSKAEVIKSTDKRFEKCAADTVAQKWKFQPAKKGGKPISSIVNMPIRFALAD